MAGFYGSLQVRGVDGASVRRVLDECARSTGTRFLIGPPLNGWVGIYPEDSGQDPELANRVAQDLGGEIFAVRVHDDDSFAYEYYRDGARLDAYDSSLVDPDDLSEAESSPSQWRPEAFAHLVSDPPRLAALKDRLAEFAARREPRATELLEAFADTVGIRNAVTSFDYLLAGAGAGDVEGWDQFGARTAIAS